jgi:hypothetical protein
MQEPPLTKNSWGRSLPYQRGTHRLPLVTAGPFSVAKLVPGLWLILSGPSYHFTSYLLSSSYVLTIHRECTKPLVCQACQRYPTCQKGSARLVTVLKTVNIFKTFRRLGNHRTRTMSCQPTFSIRGNLKRDYPLPRRGSDESVPPIAMPFLAAGPRTTAFHPRHANDRRRHG